MNIIVSLYNHFFLRICLITIINISSHIESIKKVLLINNHNSYVIKMIFFKLNIILAIIIIYIKTFKRHYKLLLITYIYRYTETLVNKVSTVQRLLNLQFSNMFPKKSKTVIRKNIYVRIRI